MHALDMEKKNTHRARQQLDSLLYDLIALSSLRLYLKVVCISTALLIFLVTHNANAQVGPGGVSSDLQLWLKANVGASNNSWNDQKPSGTKNNYTTFVGSGTISLEQSDQLNFNDVMRFPGSGALRGTAVGFPIAANSRLIFTVVRNAASASEEFIFQYGQTNSNWTAYGQFISGGKFGVDYGASAPLNPKDFVTSTTATDDPTIVMSYFTGSQEQIKINHGTTQTLSFSSLGNSVTFPTVGANANTTAQNHFNGDIAEVILYSGSPSPTDQQKIASYLALKYGVTLNGGNTDYLSSGLVPKKIWDSSKTGIGSAFKNDIAGIGRDDGSDGSDLVQLKSKSQNSDAMLTIEASSGSVGDLEFLSWANDNGAVTETSCSGCGGITKTIARSWFIQEVGDVGNLTISFDVSGSGLSGKSLSDFKLVIDDDNDLTDGELTTVAAATFSSNIVTFTGVSLSDGKYLNLSTESPKLKFTVQPSNTTSVDNISPAVEVSIVDGSDVVITSASATINLFIENNAGSGTLDGTTSSATTSGVASFSNLSIDELGTGYTLRAEATGFDNVISGTFNITVGPAAQFIIQQQPSNSALGQVISPAITVALADANGNIRTTHTGFDIDVAISTNPGGGALGGTTTQSTVNGISTFDDLTIDQLGTGYVLEFTAFGITDEQSTTFNITQSPGGVGTGLQLWLKGNVGVTGMAPITNWADQSGNGITSTINGDPSLNNDAINFNPSIKFDPNTGSRDWLETNLSIHTNTYSDLTIYAIYKPRVNSAGGVWGEDDGGWDRFLIDNTRETTLEDAVSDGDETAQNIPSIFPINKAVMTTVVFDEDQSSGSFVYANSELVRTFTSNHYTGSETSSNLFIGTIGSNSASLDSFDGDIAEIVVVSALPTTQERQQIESYLALKYGLTLDQTIALDYLASNGIAVWDASASSGYDNDIAGIGKDLASGLTQNKSISQNDNAILTIEQAAGSITDGHFMVWGNNGQSNSTTSSVALNSVTHDRMSRVWKVQEKNNTEVGSTGVGTVADIGQVNISFDLTGITYTADHVRLLIDDDGTFGSGTTISTTKGTFNGDVVTFSNISIADGDHISIATNFAPKLSFSAQPSNTLVNGGINGTTGIAVQLLDGNDNVITSSTATVTIEVETDPSGSATLSGTASKAASSGEATFTGLTIDQVATGYVLRATAAGVSATPQSSSTFNVTMAPGGIGGELRYWLDAQDLDGNGSAEGTAGEAGQSSGQVTTWTNKTGGIDFDINAGLSAGTTPDLKENQINFNGVVEFNEGMITSDYLGAQVTDFPTDNFSIFLILKTTDATNSGIFSYAISNSVDNEFLLFRPNDLEIWVNDIETDHHATLNDGVSQLLSVDWTSSGGNLNVHENGLSTSPTTVSNGSSLDASGTLILAQEQDLLGSGFGNPQQEFSGQMAEVITYASVLNSVDRRKVESYLAIKYGITLNQSVLEDYLASNGVVIWDYSEATSYGNDIAGIGKDDNSGLNQVKSKSENTGSITTIESNSGTITDGNFFIWGHNGSSTTTSSMVTVNGVSHTMMDRIWRVQEKSFVDAGSNIGTDSDLGGVNISFDLTGITYTAANVRLLIDSDDGTFDQNSTVSSVSGSFNGDMVTFTNVTDLSDGEYFTIALDFTPKLSFTAEPGNTPLSTRINAASGIQVSVVDGADQVITSSTITIVLAFGNDASGGSASLSGTLSQATQSGVATFVGVSIDELGTGYTLQATSVGNASADTSSAFNIVGAPGGIGADLRYWLDGNDLDADGTAEGSSELGVSGGEVLTWENKTGGTDFIKNTPASDITPTAPDFNEASLNFNPGLLFNHSLGTDVLGAEVTDFPTDEITHFMILQRTFTGTRAPFSYAVTSSTNEFTFFTKSTELELFHNGAELTETNFFLPSTETKLLSSYLDAGEEVRVFENGKAGESMMTPVALNNEGTIWLGQDQDTNPGTRGNNNGYGGQMGEVIVYARKLSPAERARVQAYLALKYGITLDQTAATNYENSAGTTIWDATQKSAYSNDIAGIGRDDNSGLNQKQSKTTNSDAIVTIGLGDGVSVLPTSNANNANTFSANNSFLIWGNDNAVLNAPKGSPAHDQIPTSLGVNSRLNRQWRVQETGTVGTVNVQFDLSNLPSLDGAGNPTTGTNNEADLVLLVSDEVDFTSPTATVEKVTLSFETDGDDLATFRFDFDDGDYFTLGSSQLEALPIKLLSFTGEAQENKVLLKWSTGSEEDNAHFRLERAGSDLGFETAGYVNGSGTFNGIQHYSFQDFEALRGVNYYRLIDVDVNGRENASEVIRVHHSGAPGIIATSIYPNPVTAGEEVIIKLPNGELASDYTIALSNTQGQPPQKVLSRVIQKSSIGLSTESLRSGIYLVRLTSVYGKTSFQKLIIKN